MSVATMVYVAVVTGPSDFQMGWDIYAAGGADSDCANREQVRGWWMALDADCTCDMLTDMGKRGISGEQMDEVLDELHLAFC